MTNMIVTPRGIPLVRAGATRLALLSALLVAPSPAQSELRLSTPDHDLSAAFEWAQRQALQYVSPGSDPVGPWYEAALPNREAFCMRDVSHQSMGAHALRLDPQNRNMLEKFAANISASKDWCSYWEINRHNLPAPVDYRNDDDFWYNLPANFDVLDACFRMYLWSGDRAFLDGAAFQEFYQRTVNEYIVRWDLQLARIMLRQRIMNVHATGDTAKRFAASRGIPSYDEARRDFTVAVDLIAAQIAVYSAYARIEMLRGERKIAGRFLQRAADTRKFLNSTWWDAEHGEYYAYADLQHRLIPGSMIASVLYFGAVDKARLPPSRDALLRRIRTHPMNVEGQSHLPEVLYRYGQHEAAYEQLLDLSRPGKPRREYPVVAFAVVGAIVNGLMGIEVDRTRVQPEVEWKTDMDGVVMTLPRLTAHTSAADLQNLLVRGNNISVRHEGVRKTTLSNITGPVLTWDACFPGSDARLWVDGRPASARVTSSYGPEANMSCVSTKVAPGNVVTVERRNLCQ